MIQTKENGERKLSQQQLPDSLKAKYNEPKHSLHNDPHTELVNGSSGRKYDSRPDRSLESQFSIPLSEEYAFKPRKIRVFTIGAGFSGLLMAHKFQHRFPDMQNIVDHTIFEAHDDLGGTWLVNDYPGVKCDVPAHIYAFPFDPNPNWSRFYSSGPEIEEYLRSTARKWNLYRDIKLGTRVTSATWLEDKGEWRVTVEHKGETRDEFCDVLVSAQGVLTHPSWPSVSGLNDFKGHITHSARWDHDYDYSHKRIAVIGNGSSGIQIVPQMAKLEGTEVMNFIRTAAWVYYRVPPSKHLGREVDDPNPEYSVQDKERFRDPVKHHAYRKGIIARTNRAFRMLTKGELNEEAVRFASQQMAEKLNHDPELCEALIPKFEVGCRRITPGPGYLESFSRPNCHLTKTPISHISDDTVHTTDGKSFKCDVLICATGFDVSHRPRYPFIGRNGVNLAEKWAEYPESYISVATSDFPNYFMMMGPNCLGGHGSLVESLNWTGDYIVKWIRKIATEDIKSVVPKQSAVEAFNQYSDEIHKTLVWSGSCKSWYKRNKVDGRVTALFGGSAVLFNRLMQDIRGEHFDVEYRSSNPFKFMGNGFTEFEMEEESDLAWYVELPEKLEDGGQNVDDGVNTYL